MGLEAAGFKTVLATDIDTHSCTTLKWGAAEAKRRKKPFLQHAEIIQGDIADPAVERQIITTARKHAPIALLAGGPPCQAFSVFGRRKGTQDPRGKLAFNYLQILAALKPTAFVFENVYGLLTIEGGKIFEELCERLASPVRGTKYELSIVRENAVHFAVPQFRDRVFIVGHSAGKRLPGLTRVTSDNGSLFERPWRTVSDALRSLPPIGSEYPANHVGREHSDRIIDRYKHLAPGERDHFTRINKLDLSKPSFTIIVGSDKGGGKGHVHPTEPREVTPRESARIQTFPDWWAFSGTSRHPIRQVGNAVPPLLGAAVASDIRDVLLGAGRYKFREVVDRLDQRHLFASEDEWPNTM